jgi:hypothetical protein
MLAILYTVGIAVADLVKSRARIHGGLLMCWALM